MILQRVRRLATLACATRSGCWWTARAASLVVLVACETPWIADRRLTTQLEYEVVLPRREFPHARVVPGSSGQFAVASSATGEVRVFAASGRMTGQFSLSGQGTANEFHLGRGGWIRDTALWFFDSRARRVAIVTLGAPDGPRARFTTAEALAGVPEPSSALLAPLAVRSDLSIVAMKYSVNSADPSVRAVDSILAFVSVPDGAAATTVSTIDGGAPYIRRRTQTGGHFVLPIPYYPMERFSVSPSGDRIVVVRADMVTTEGPRTIVEFLSPDGRQTGGASLALPMYEVSARDVSAALRGATEYPLNFPTSVVAAAAAAAPSTTSGVRGLVVGADGVVAITLQDRTGGRCSLLLDRLGRTLGTVALPGKSQVVFAGEGWLLVTERRGGAGPAVRRLRYSATALRGFVHEGDCGARAQS